MKAAEQEVLEREVAPSLPTAGGAVDAQVSTARRYPRSITMFTRRATEMATLTDEIAASCIYAVPRGGKSIEGPSARLAEICASAWGNLRIQAGVTGNDATFVTGRGEAWDVENNVAIGYEVRRRITDKSGRTFNDDMTTVTGNAAASIALRNAVFKVIPTSFWRPIYLKCREVIAGKAETFAKRRDEMLKAFAVMGVPDARVCQALGLNGKGDLTIDHMVTLTGFYTALRDGDTTLEEAFPEGGGLGSTPKPGQRKSEQTAKAADTTAAAQPEGQTAAATPAAPVAETKSPIGIITQVETTEKGTRILLDSGFACATVDKALAEEATKARDSKSRVELATRKSSNPAKYLPTLEEIVALPDGDAQ